MTTAPARKTSRRTAATARRTASKSIDLEAPPDHLSPLARELWRRLLADFHLSDGAGLGLVRAAREALDRAERARLVIEAEGQTVRDRFGQARPHPLLVTQHASRALLVASLRAMHLEPGTAGVVDD